MRKILMIALNTVVLMGMASMSFAASSLDAAALGYTCLAAALGIGIARPSAAASAWAWASKAPAKALPATLT